MRSHRGPSTVYLEIATWRGSYARWIVKRCRRDYFNREIGKPAIKVAQTRW